MSVYEYQAKSIQGEPVHLSDFQGKVLLIVNTASKCGFTPQYAELEKLYQKYQDKGFSVLGFPCNQFKDQEPESNDKILSFCQVNYGVTFPMFAKADVNGEHALALFQYLRSQKDFGGFDLNHPIGKKLDEILSAENKDYREGNEIKWNFTKFLIDQNGRVVKRYEPTTDIREIERDLNILLK